MEDLENISFKDLAVGKSAAFRITDSNGRLVAEAKRKQSSSGVVGR